MAALDSTLISLYIPLCFGVINSTIDPFLPIPLSLMKSATSAPSDHSLYIAIIAPLCRSIRSALILKS